MESLICVRRGFLSALLLLVVHSLSAENNVLKTDTSLVINSTVSTNNGNSSLSIDEYKEKICNHSSTCDLVDRVPTQYRDLRTRDCMCDQECVAYGDCCRDSKWGPGGMDARRRTDDFACVTTQTEGSVYMKTACPPSWNASSAVKDNCETRNSTILTVDVLISTPVTSAQRGITYKNLFCAICNGDDEFAFWNIAVAYVELANEATATVEYADASGTSSNDTAKPALDAIVSALAVNDTAEWFWMATVGNATYRCYLHPVLPAANVSQSSVRYCVPDVVESCLPEWQGLPIAHSCSNYTSYTPAAGTVYKNADCAVCNNVSDVGTTSCRWRTIDVDSSRPFSIPITHSRIPKIDHCDVVPEGNTARRTFCPVATTPGSAGSTFMECYPSTESQKKPCLIDGFFKLGTGFEYVDNETIFLKGWDVVYPEAEYFAINYTDMYVCGTYIPRTKYQQVMDFLDDWVSETLIKISIVCLLLHLLFFQQLPEMKNLSGKSLAAFSLTLMAALLCFEIGPRLPRCEVISAVMHYALLSCFAWMLLMSYDCWLSLYRATKKFRAAGGKHATRFALYCLLSNVVPTAIVSVAVYFQLAPADVIACDLKPGYGKYNQCFISQKKALYVFFFVPASTMFLGNICFFAHTAFMIYHSQRKTVNPNTRNDFRLYTRLALMMGLTWTLGSLTTITNNEIVGLLFSTFNMSQGIFIFFGFTFKQKTLKSLSSKHKDNALISTTLSTFITSEPSPDSVLSSVNAHTETSVCPAPT